jgi:hypothetical protein
VCVEPEINTSSPLPCSSNFYRNLNAHIHHTPPSAPHQFPLCYVKTVDSSNDFVPPLREICTSSGSNLRKHELTLIGPTVFEACASQERRFHPHDDEVMLFGSVESSNCVCSSSSRLMDYGAAIHLTPILPSYQQQASGAASDVPCD